MDFDPSLLPQQIVTDIPESFDLFGRSLRKWRVVLIQPRWSFAHRSKKGEAKNQNKKVRTFSLNELMRLPISDITEKSSIVFIWTPDSQLPLAIRLMESWGYRYNGVAFYWAKTRPDTNIENMHHLRDLPMSTGYITRSNPMPLLMGVKGEPGLKKHHINGDFRTRGDIRKLQFFPRQEDRQTPPEFRDLVEMLYDGPYLEIFGKGKEGWGSWQPPKTQP